MEKHNFFSLTKFLLIICCFCQINSYYFQNIHFLISAKLNGTSPVISLNQLKEDSNYVNFLFDFSYHSKNVPNSKNSAYFKLNTNIDIKIDDKSSDNLPKFIFFEDEWTKIEKKKIAKNLSYKNIEILSKEKNKNDNNVYTYYFKIESQNEKENTLMIKIPTQKIKEGFIGIENILNAI